MGGRGLLLLESYSRRNPEERTWRVIDAARSVAEARGASVAQVVVAWLDEASLPIVDEYPYADLGVGQRDRRPPALTLRVRDRRVSFVST